MRQYTQTEFIRIMQRSGFLYNRCNGSHLIYINNKGRHISVPHKLNSTIARRLIKENNLDINIKNKKK